MDGQGRGRTGGEGGHQREEDKAAAQDGRREGKGRGGKAWQRRRTAGGGAGQREEDTATGQNGRRRDRAEEILKTATGAVLEMGGDQFHSSIAPSPGAPQQSCKPDD